MELAKIRNLSDEELKTTGVQTSEQLFRIRFQAKLGQNEGIRKLRELRKDVARIKTIAKERELGIQREVPEAKAKKAAAPVKAKKTTKSKKEAK
ncbi:50S ribosomal protein L29 [Acidicapsa ligni]|uniref:50S ribosomal protein L29 n=1 Tax=Acidicapsa ligni TaxID=542300 RepID=UPI0021E0238B|nr:50S ribosomal protein L29 [Acidicapsa ligni]